MPLAFLSPGIVGAIANGTAPTGLTVSGLARSLPHKWIDQERMFGPLEQAQYFWGGRNYCWYSDGWHGPGFYWCGYRWREGYGWGGGHGWHATSMPRTLILWRACSRGEPSTSSATRRRAVRSWSIIGCAGLLPRGPRRLRDKSRRARGRIEAGSAEHSASEDHKIAVDGRHLSERCRS
jgi:hypothetical protein